MQTQPTEKQLKAVVAIVGIITETVHAADQTVGVPGGTIYAALMTQGVSLATYEALMRLAVRSGKIAQRGQCYFAAGV